MEQFFKNYEYTIAFLGVLATFSAVGLSLWLAFRSEKVRLKAVMELFEVIHNKSLLSQIISVKIDNNGQRTAHFNQAFCSVYVGKKNPAYLLESVNEGINWEIQPYEPKSVNIDFGRFLSSINACFKDHQISNINQISIELHSKQGARYKVKLSKNIKDLLNKQLLAMLEV